ncbi:MAG: S8 family serine peptidase [Reyranellaceae bacterium]
MGAKYVVFVEEMLVAGSTQMIAANVGLGVGRTPMAPPLSVAQELALRRTVLSSLASTLVGQPAGGAIGAHGAAMAMAEAPAVLPAPAAAAVEKVQILEGISAIVIDDDSVDVASLHGVHGLTVVENIELRLPDPVVFAAAVAPPVDWHLTTIGLTSGLAGGKDILVGVLDTGIDAAHAEFAGKKIHFAEFDPIGRNISSVPRDAGDHGTHVSSIATGARAGVAPDADLAVAAVLTTRGADGRMSGSLVQIVNGFNWLVTTQFRQGVPGVDVINASLGGTGFNAYLQPAVRTAFSVGVPLIAAIGNSGRAGPDLHGSPGNYPEALGIGASDVADVVAEFSDWGISGPPTGPAGPNYPVPDFCAPGVLVQAARPGGGFQPMSGTSMATPVVTGVAARRMALTPALVGKPAALFTDLRSRLAPCTPHAPGGNLGGAGRIIA